MGEITNFRGEVIDPDATLHADGDTFVAEVGRRVRRARERKGMTRRVLSEMSDVSQRYLAQLESGSGNISIALLKRVADALDHRIEWLVGDEDPWTSESAFVAEHYRSATEMQRRDIMNILQAVPAAQLRQQRICLLGLRGAGKSTLAEKLSKRLGLPYVELNREIEAQSGMPVEDVIGLYGQEGYRRLERQAIERLVAVSDAMILAAAGGVVSEPETYGYVLRHFHTVWLKASPDEHMRRVQAQGDHRPMAGNPKAMEELKAILASREALYARAEAMIDTSGKSVEDCLEELASFVTSLPKV